MSISQYNSVYLSIYWGLLKLEVPEKVSGTFSGTFTATPRKSRGLSRGLSLRRRSHPGTYPGTFTERYNMIYFYIKSIYWNILSLTWYILRCAQAYLHKLYAQTVAELNNILQAHVVDGPWQPLGAWNGSRGTMCARCYPFNMEKRRFHSVNPKVCPSVLCTS